MNKLKQTFITTIMVLFILWACLALFGTLVPWWGETFGDAENEIDAILQAEKDAKACGDYPVKYIDGVLFCKCTETESQKPGHCLEKYK